MVASEGNRPTSTPKETKKEEDAMEARALGRTKAQVSLIGQGTWNMEDGAPPCTFLCLLHLHGSKPLPKVIHD
jgi:hypothetical protein